MKSLQNVKITHRWWLPLAHEALIPGHVHIWQACLDMDQRQLSGLLKALAPHELERANRFRFERDKNNFIAARGILRNILAAYSEIAPAKIDFKYSPNGKPVIETTLKSGKLRFNVSHSGAFALYAVTLDQEVGVDIELIRENVAVAEIARKFFSNEEIDSLERTHKDRLHELFYQYWTRKEAVLKAMGEGISFPMQKVDTSSINGKTVTRISVPASIEERGSFYLQDLLAGYGYAAAVAIAQKIL